MGDSDQDSSWWQKGWIWVVGVVVVVVYVGLIVIEQLGART